MDSYTVNADERRGAWHLKEQQKFSCKLQTFVNFSLCFPHSLCVCVCVRVCVCVCVLSHLWLWQLLPARLLCLFYRILQARILEWVAISSSKESFQPRNQTCISCIGRQILYHWATKEAPTLLGVFGLKSPHDSGWNFLWKILAPLLCNHLSFPLSFTS